MLLFDKQIKDQMTKELESCKDNVILISAFCKLDSIKQVDSILNSSVKNKTLLVRFKTEDIINKVTDFEIVEYCKKNNWKLYLNFDLHAKTFIFDKFRCIVGSANLTNKGVNLYNKKQGNYEIAIIQEMNTHDLSNIIKLVNDSILVNSEIEKILKDIYAQLVLKSNKNFQSGWNNILNEKYNPSSFILFTYDFPENQFSLQDSNFEFLELYNEKSVNLIKMKFLQSKCIKWLYAIINKKCNKEIYFGELTKILHSSLLNDPTPYRKEVKELLSNLLNWINYFKVEEFTIDRPNFSQRITLNPRQ